MNLKTSFVNLSDLRKAVFYNIRDSYGIKLLTKIRVSFFGHI